MAKKKETKQSPMQRLFVYAGKYKYLTIASWILAAISAFVALVPFYFIWRIIKEVLYVAPNYADAENLSVYGWSAKESKLLTRIHFYRRNTTGKAGCICSERRENVACFVFELRM